MAYIEKLLLVNIRFILFISSWNANHELNEEIS